MTVAAETVGKVSLDNPVTLMHGDVVDALEMIPDHSVSAVLTDPPYALAMGGGTEGWDNYTPPRFAAWCQQWSEELVRVVKPGGWVVAFGCYDEQTEVLTQRGWVRFPEAAEDDVFASLDPETQEVEWQRPVTVIRQPHHGPMHVYKTNRVDLCVTPNHKMLSSDMRGKKFKLRRSDELPASVRMLKRSAGRADAQEMPFVLPGCRSGLGHGHSVQKPSVEVPARVWAAFLGFWLAEGHASIGPGNRGGQLSHVAITNFNDDDMTEMAEMLSPYFTVLRYPGSGRLRINDRRLYNYLSQFGKAWEKFIPDWLRTQPAEVIRIFLDWYARGDGNDEGRIFTSSPRMCDDLQEVAMYAGWAADFMQRADAGHVGGFGHRGGQIVARRPQYVVRLLKAQTAPAVYDRPDRQSVSGRSLLSEEEWSGRFVYCVELPRHHTLYVRRNGKAVWCGNSGRTWHRLTQGMEDAGLDIIDSVIWHYPSGFMRNVNIPERLAKAGSVERARQMAGRGTALHSRHEPAILARAPMKGSLVSTVAEHGTATMDLTSTRLPNGTAPPNVLVQHSPFCGGAEDGLECIVGCPVPQMGQFMEYFPAFRFEGKPSKAERPRITVEAGEGTKKLSTLGQVQLFVCTVCAAVTQSYMGSGGTHAKTPHRVCAHDSYEPIRENFSATIAHNTVKPLGLMRWLVRLLTLPGDLVLEPFAGSGSTVEAAVMEGRPVIGIERDLSSVELCRVRLRRQGCFTHEGE